MEDTASNVALMNSAQRAEGSPLYRAVDHSFEDVLTAADDLDTIGYELVGMLKSNLRVMVSYGASVAVQLQTSGEIWRLPTNDHGNHFYTDDPSTQHPSMHSKPIDWLLLIEALPAVLDQLGAELQIESHR
jgi:hypothetical protein